MKIQITEIMKTLICMAVICLTFTVQVFSQSKENKSKAYVTTGGELIFSFANAEQNGNSLGSVLRFSPVFNLQVMVNQDMSKNFGLFTGLSVRNVGYITDDYKDPANNLIYKKKFRTYNLALPVGFKVGDLDKTFFYGGYEVELAFSYKEKTYDGGDKIDKISGWFSDRNELFQHGFLAGVQFPRGVNVKFKYYLSEFHNQDYTTNANVKPYAGLKTNIFYVSLNFFLFKNLDMYYK
jgi:Outer membrane protein beta-barrel domain